MSAVTLMQKEIKPD